VVCASQHGPPLRLLSDAPQARRMPAALVEPLSELVRRPLGLVEADDQLLVPG